MTAGVIALGQACQLKILEAVAKFDAFDEGNDPYGEHDFGAIEVEGERLLWKIEYYDRKSQRTHPTRLTRPSPRECSPSCWLRSTKRKTRYQMDRADHGRLD
jgi:hypothetical protein